MYGGCVYDEYIVISYTVKVMVRINFTRLLRTYSFNSIDPAAYLRSVPIAVYFSFRAYSGEVEFLCKTRTGTRTILLLLKRKYVTTRPEHNHIVTDVEAMP